MNTAPIGVNKLDKNEFRSGKGEIEFVYNILAPDLLLFTVAISFTFGLLAYIF